MITQLQLSELQLSIIEGKICPYCKNKTEYVDSSVIYGKSYGMIYLCKKCDAYCGVHKNTSNSLGRLANAKLREAKKQAHLYFDKIWQLNIMTRTEAYKWLSETLGLLPEYTHIGMFSNKTCEDVVFFSKQALNDNRRLDLDFGVEPKTPYYEL